ncbi:MAG: diadenylate cyclase CdaA [Candidatus Cryptobacteroides sp.]
MPTLLIDIGFLHFNFADVLDILMVAAIIYILFRWLKGSAAMNIFLAIVALLLLRVLVGLLNMKMTSSILSTLIDVGAIALVVIFQPEIRRFLNNIGRRAMGSKAARPLLDRILGKRSENMSADEVDELVQACFEMGEQKTGALIVLPYRSNMDDIISTGDTVDARISRPLIENIFFKNSPLHDGAMILGPNRIIAARCTLPITDRSIPARYGMRHKAAVGLSERYDASVIVVSEQTGIVSFVKEGKITPVKNMNTLKLLIANDGNPKTGSETGV